VKIAASNAGFDVREKHMHRSRETTWNGDRPQSERVDLEAIAVLRMLAMMIHVHVMAMDCSRCVIFLDVILGCSNLLDGEDLRSSRSAMN
jgi:hypothetical protein